jgi:hypothetical protein
METLVKNFRKQVVIAAQNPNFIHHQWYVKYHLEIVEKISLELCDHYPNADRDLVILLVWLHDYGKMINSIDPHQATLTYGKAKLLKLGFSPPLVEKVISFIDLFDKKIDLDKDFTPIEVKIVSSADAASHLVGPFYYMWMHENGDRDPFYLMESTLKKAKMEWEKKIVLPEVKQAFSDRQSFTLELNGLLPEKFLN